MLIRDKYALKCMVLVLGCCRCSIAQNPVADGKSNQISLQVKPASEFDLKRLELAATVHCCAGDFRAASHELQELSAIHRNDLHAKWPATYLARLANDARLMSERNDEAQKTFADTHTNILLAKKSLEAGEYKTAEELAHTCVKSMTAIGKEYLLYYECLVELGAIQLEMGRIPESINNFETCKSRMHDASLTDSAVYPTLLFLYGAALGRNGDLEKSEKVIRESIQLFEENLDTSSPGFFQAHSELARTLFVAKRSDAAARECLFIIPACRRDLGKLSREYAVACKICGDITERNGNSDSSLLLFQESINTFERLSMGRNDLLEAEALECYLAVAEKLKTDAEQLAQARLRLTKLQERSREKVADRRK